MSFSITDVDVWPRLAPQIEAERRRRMDDLLHITTLEGMRQQQGFIEALDWVVDQSRPAQDEEG